MDFVIPGNTQIFLTENSSFLIKDSKVESFSGVKALGLPPFLPIFRRSGENPYMKKTRPQVHELLFQDRDKDVSD